MLHYTVNLERFRHSTVIQLQRASDRARTLKVLRGVIPVEVVVERKRVVVSENFLESTGTECRIGQEAIQISRVRSLNEKGYAVRLAVPPFHKDARTFWRERTHLEDARGNRFARGGYGHYEQGDMVNEVGLEFKAGQDPQMGPPKRLVIEDWVIVRHLIRFEFKDLPLP